MWTRTQRAYLAMGTAIAITAWASWKLLNTPSLAAPDVAPTRPHVNAIGAAASGLFPPGNGNASATVVHPGQTSPPLQSTGCTATHGQGFGSGNGVPCSQCTSSCSSSASNTANARILFGTPVVLQVFSISAPWTEFEVSSTPETFGNLVPCSINYDAEWHGEWTRFGVLTAGTTSEVRITFTLRDMTGNAPVTAHLVHSLKPEGAGIDVLEIGSWINHDSKKDSFVAMLERGHTYRLTYTLRLEAKAWGNAYVNLDYQTGGWGTWWNELTVSIAEDPEDLVNELREELLSLIENHMHSYRTGHGQGHNNTEAVSGPSLLPP